MFITVKCCLVTTYFSDCTWSYHAGLIVWPCHKNISFKATGEGNNDESDTVGDYNS